MTPNRPPQTIRNELITLRAERDPLANLPSLHAQEQIVQRLTTQALVALPADAPGAKSDLVLAVVARDDLAARWDELAALNTRIARLTEELSEAERDEQAAARADAARRGQDAITAYKYSALETARAYRRMLNAAPTLDARTRELHIGALMPWGWTGDLGAAMQQGTMPWEDKK